MRICEQCHQEKPDALFAQVRRRLDTTCRACRRDNRAVLERRRLMSKPLPKVKHSLAVYDW